MSQPIPILVPGETCWRIERAERLSVIIDAANYFHYAKAAMSLADQRIMLVGWDFDTRIELEPDGSTMPGPNKLGSFLSWLVKERSALDVYLLKWNIGTWAAIGRGMMPVTLLNWMTHQRLHLLSDAAHPVGAAHHEKVIVIDDAFAFCGGIDMTVERWDTRDHPDDDVRRTDPGGDQHGPWHDATAAVQGPIANALGELVRSRWASAGGEDLEPVRRGRSIWPQGLLPTMINVDVAIARTRAEYRGQDVVREIEALYLAVIREARSSLYIETQYLASRIVVEAIAERLQSADCPEIVLVIPRNAAGWLEQLAMDGARRRLLDVLWQNDIHDKVRVFYPVTEAGKPIYVHAKVLVMDDRLLRIGSSNLNNRSMGFDSECDLAVDAAMQADPEFVAASIIDIRDDLLCEHLGCTRAELASAFESAGGSLIGAVESLCRDDGRTLRRFEPEDVSEEVSVLAENDFMDPEGVTPSGPRWVRALRERAHRRLHKDSTSQ
ncbi:MAG: phospholipase D-like domain-containing protein [Nocardiaceae bacterium]|nr:phospholipase D-like domain-containing protein [Nocardiaceae bacterium]